MSNLKALALTTTITTCYGFMRYHISFVCLCLWYINTNHSRLDTVCDMPHISLNLICWTHLLAINKHCAYIILCLSLCVKKRKTPSGGEIKRKLKIKIVYVCVVWGVKLVSDLVLWIHSNVFRSSTCFVTASFDRIHLIAVESLNTFYWI